MKHKSERIEWDPSKSAIESARETLPALAASLFAEGRRVSADPVKVEELHEFRLHAKRFRYTLELFQPLFGPAMDERLAEMRRLQQSLGSINDCATTRKLLKKMRNSGKRGQQAQLALDYLVEVEQERTKAFLKFWRETFDVPGAEERWVRYLRDYAGRAQQHPWK